MPHANTFLSDQSGAVTVDWVVLTAAVVGLGLAAMAVVSGGVQDLSTDVDAQLKGNDIIRVAFSGLTKDDFRFYTPETIASQREGFASLDNAALVAAYQSAATTYAVELAEHANLQAQLDAGTLIYYSSDNALYRAADWDRNADRPLNGAAAAVTTVDYEAARSPYESQLITADELKQRGVAVP